MRAGVFVRTGLERERWTTRIQQHPMVTLKFICEGPTCLYYTAGRQAPAGADPFSLFPFQGVQA